MYKTLIDCESLATHLDEPSWVIVDCRFDLADTEAGYQLYLENHIPGALYAHLDNDLSSAPVTDCGRHPLPDVATLTKRFSQMGISNETQVVVYDHVFGAMAGRLWWMLRYMGHESVAVLDGGWQAWQSAGKPVRSGDESCQYRAFTGQANTDDLVLLDDLESVTCLLDARDPGRYRGEQEPIDRVPGHIPGARNRFWQQNLAENGCFLMVDELRQSLEGTLGDTAVSDLVCYCGSGVTACHNILAMVHAGFEQPRLYVGSWSEWCSDAGRPVATGEEI